jgi:hypothetical protein
MNNSKHVYTSSGIIKNADKPRVGVISQNSVCSDLLDDIIREGINLSYESYLEDIRADCVREGKTEEETEEAIEEASQCYESDSDMYLFGDWLKNESGQYEIDRNGKEGYALTYGGMGNLCIEWSKTVKPCHHTSPCYVMADGSGPCGDLDTKGDSVLAYALPNDCLYTE